jgi:hypothetical protein
MSEAPILIALRQFVDKYAWDKSLLAKPDISSTGAAPARRSARTLQDTSISDFIKQQERAA